MNTNPNTTIEAAAAEARELLEYAADACEPGLTALNCVSDVSSDDWSLAARVLAYGAVAQVQATGMNAHPTKIIRVARTALLAIDATFVTGPRA